MRSHRSFLQRLGEDLLEALRLAENQQWHHLPAVDERYQCYLRIGTQLEEVTRRVIRYDNTRRSVEKRGKQAYVLDSSQDAVDRYKSQFQLGFGSEARPELDERDQRPGQSGNDCD